MSTSTGLVRRISEAAKGAATGTNRIQERTMRFMVMVKATKESERAFCRSQKRSPRWAG